MRLPDQQQQLETILNLPNLKHAKIDMTGLGLGLFEYTQQKFPNKISGINFSSSISSFSSLPSVKRPPRLELRQIHQIREIQEPRSRSSRISHFSQLKITHVPRKPRPRDRAANPIYPVKKNALTLNPIP